MEIQYIKSKIYEVREIKVMLDFDLAKLYKVETKNLNLAVKRNLKRFPSDFMFQLSKEEWENLRFQFATSSWGGRRYMPYAFTEQGVAMLSGILNSDIAIEVNISIMRAFVSIRQYLATGIQTKDIEDLRNRIKALESGTEEILQSVNDLSEDTQKEFDDVYLALSQLAAKQKELKKPRNPIGFNISKKED